MQHSPVKYKCVTTTTSATLTTLLKHDDIVKWKHFSRYWAVTRSFDVFFDLRLKKRLSKQRWSWWCKTVMGKVICYNIIRNKISVVSCPILFVLTWFCHSHWWTALVLFGSAWFTSFLDHHSWQMASSTKNNTSISTHCTIGNASIYVFCSWISLLREIWI